MSTLAWSVVTSVQGRVPVASEVFYLCILTMLYVIQNLTRVLILVNCMLCFHNIRLCFYCHWIKVIKMVPVAGIEFGCKLE